VAGDVVEPPTRSYRPPVSLGLLIGLSLALGVAAWLFFLWTVKSGQYDDPEGPKYRMLEDEEEERPPAAPRERPDGRRNGD
jgi:cbb3-type cytochrome oxidase maturation protein